MALSQRIVVYTCITAGYDDLLPPCSVEPEIEYVCFTDRPPRETGAWDTRRVPVDKGDSAANNRFVKMHPHLLFPDREMSVYIDGNLQPVMGIAALLHGALRVGNIALYEHPDRDCVYAEARNCAANGFGWAWRIEAQVREYERVGYPRKHGLYEANVLVRRHHACEVRSLMEAWWAAYSSGVRRDQLSLSYLAWRAGVNMVNLGPSDPRGPQKHFVWRKSHRTSKPLATRARGWLNRKLFLATCMRDWEPWPDPHVGGGVK